MDVETNCASQLRMIPLAEITVDKSSDFLRDQISIRRELMGQMVGQLYPIILLGEICELMDRLARRDR